MCRIVAPLAAAIILPLSLAGPLAAAEAQDVLMGMKIERAEQTGEGMTAASTGAEFMLDNAGVMRCFQRIPIRREVARVKLSPCASAPVLKDRGDFACTVVADGADLTIQGDSLVIVKARKDLTLSLNGLFKPAYHAGKDGRWMFIDGLGGWGVYPVANKESRSPDLKQKEWSLEYQLKKGDEVWLSVFPPRPYNWQRAYGDLMAHEGNGAPYRFPSDELIRSTAKRCNVMVVHSYFWPGGDKSPWMIPGFVFKTPEDKGQFDRVRDEAHRCGVKLLPYCSYYYYSGEDYFGNIRRVLDEYKADGIYVDGVANDFRKAYETVRQMRRMLGDDRLLFRHCTSDPLQSNRIYCPFIDTYCDYIYRGESGRAGLSLDDFLRWTISGYNISNAVGYWVYTGSTGKPGYVRQVPSAADIDAAIRNEVRLPRTEIGYEEELAWKPNDGHLREFDPYYYGKLAAMYERLKAVVGQDEFVKFPGTPAQFLFGDNGSQRTDSQGHGASAKP